MGVPRICIRELLPLALLLACAACGKETTNPTTLEGEGGAGGATEGETTAEGLDRILIEAWGGPSGRVATVVALEDPRVGPQFTCDAPQREGACQLTSCQTGGIASPAPGGGNFGPIVATAGEATVDLVYDRFGYPTVYFPAGVALGTGEAMRFRGGGKAGVPAFDVSAIIPGLLEITAPAPASDGAPAAIDTAADLAVTWKPIELGQVHFDINATNLNPGGTASSITCTFEGAAGSGVIAQKLLSSLKALAQTPDIYAFPVSELDETTVVHGLTIATRSFQNSANDHTEFKVTLE